MARRVEPTYLPREVDAYRRSGAWSGDLLSAYGAELARTRPETVAVVDRERRYTFGEVERWALAVADFLVGLGVEPGQAVTFQLPNWVEAVVLNQAILKIGAVANPVIPIYREHELSFILREAESPVFVVPGSFRQFDYLGMARRLQREVPSTRHIVVVGEPAGQGANPLPRLPSEAASVGRHAPPSHSPDDPVLLLYTSGTTADPKGAIHTHNTLVAENRGMIDWFGWTSADAIFMPSPVTHITGYLYGLLLPFMLGTRVVLLDVWEPAQALRLVLDEGCTLTVGATPFLQDLVEIARREGLRPGSIPLRVFACGGADVPPKLIRDAGELGIGAGRVYGSTEYPTYTCYNAQSTPEQRAETDGLPMSGEGRIVDDDGNERPPGQPGELLLRGPERFLGYLHAPLNAEAFTPDGWFRSGDLIARREDGYLEVKGRIKDVINRGGEKISAKEVEDILFRHPLVREVAVVAMPDERLTERACAYVVPSDPAHPPTLGDLLELLTRERVAKQKCPERLEVVPGLPKTASGKIQKNRLRDDIRQKLGVG